MILGFRGLVLSNDENKLSIQEVVEIDPLNQVGISLARGFLKKNFKDYHNTFQ